jgi:hypothetical protein
VSVPPDASEAPSSATAKLALIVSLAVALLLVGVTVGVVFYVRDIQRDVDAFEERLAAFERDLAAVREEVEGEFDVPDPAPPTAGGRLPNAFVALRHRDNPVVPGTGRFTELLTLRLRPGAYQVFAKVGLHNAAPRSQLDTGCTLVPSKTDGTPGTPGMQGSDYAAMHLAPAGHPGEEGAVTLVVSQELDRPGSVVLGCEASGYAADASASYGSIVAIEVGSITTESVPP